jgi:hypothetical protein
VQRATDAARLSLEQRDAPERRCPPLRAIATRRLAPGDAVDIHGTVAVQVIQARGVRPQPLPFGAGLLATAADHSLRNVASDPLVVRIAPRSFDAGLC